MGPPVGWLGRGRLGRCRLVTRASAVARSCHVGAGRRRHCSRGPSDAIVARPLLHRMRPAPDLATLLESRFDCVWRRGRTSRGQHPHCLLATASWIEDGSTFQLRDFMPEASVSHLARRAPRPLPIMEARSSVAMKSFHLDDLQKVGKRFVRDWLSLFRSRRVLVGRRDGGHHRSCRMGSTPPAARALLAMRCSRVQMFITPRRLASLCCTAPGRVGR